MNSPRKYVVPPPRYWRFEPAGFSALHGHVRVGAGAAPLHAPAPEPARDAIRPPPLAAPRAD